MMCDVMPTIAEDNISQRSSQFSGEDANFEQLMVSMLDERDKLMDSLREAQERLGESEMKLTDAEKERDSLQRQINANLPQVCFTLFSYLYYILSRRFVVCNVICDLLSNRLREEHVVRWQQCGRKSMLRWFFSPNVYHIVFLYVFTQYLCNLL